MPTNAALPEIYYLTDDGLTPNSPLPVVIYRQVTSLRGEETARWLEEIFLNNGWKGILFWARPVVLTNYGNAKKQPAG